ncbi:MAG: ISKra4 family transposase [Planctomycetes bacterium]|nr:ISKra4 family transposase [Planctomycetota bacterium]
MKTDIVSLSRNEVVVKVSIPLTSSMLNTEESIQKSLNEAGCLATQVALSRFDTNGDPIQVKGDRFTTKGQIEKIYQTPYGEITLPRHVYQNSKGGKTYCPLEKDAKTIVQSTPKLAKMVSSKYASLGSRNVQKDLVENHGRFISHSYIKDISDAVALVLLGKEEKWNYLPPVPPESVSVVGLGLDGTCMFMTDDGWRQAMVGTIAFFDECGERLDTIYLAAAPEYGKATFTGRLENEISRIKSLYPDACYVGIADGAKDNWSFLANHTQCQILDFFHASEYITKVADIVFRKKEKRAEWLKSSCHKLKHEKKGAKKLLNEFVVYRKKKMSAQNQDKLEATITYFSNHHQKMNYSEYIAKKYPIGSGVTESACKVIVKQRLCNSGMKWKQLGAEAVLCLRTLNYSSKRWGQAWDKINRYGI